MGVAFHHYSLRSHRYRAADVDPSTDTASRTRRAGQPRRRHHGRGLPTETLPDSVSAQRLHYRRQDEVRRAFPGIDNAGLPTSATGSDRTYSRRGTHRRAGKAVPGNAPGATDNIRVFLRWSPRAILLTLKQSNIQTDPILAARVKADLTRSRTPRQTAGRSRLEATATNLETMTKLPDTQSRTVSHEAFLSVDLRSAQGRAVEVPVLAIANVLNS